MKFSKNIVDPIQDLLGSLGGQQAPGWDGITFAWYVMVEQYVENLTVLLYDE